MTEDIMDRMKRWSGQEKPEVLPVGTRLVWTIARANKIVNQVERWPDMEF